MIFEILVVLLLTVINGLLAMSELAIVSARPAKLKVMAEQGSQGAATALLHATKPAAKPRSPQAPTDEAQVDEDDEAHTPVPRPTCGPLQCEMVLPMTTPLSLRAHQTQLARVDRPSPYHSLQTCQAR